MANEIRRARRNASRSRRDRAIERRTLPVRLRVMGRAAAVQAGREILLASAEIETLERGRSPWQG